jgi:hypothetical protein
MLRLHRSLYTTLNNVFIIKVAVSVDPCHGEALNNIAVLEIRRQKFDLARACLSSAVDVGPHLFEPLYNTGNVNRLRSKTFCLIILSRQH